METFAKWWIVAIMVIHITATCSMVGKPRSTKPVTAGHGILTLAFWGLYIAAIIVWWET